MLFDVNKPWRFAENKVRRTVEKKCREERKRISKEIKNVQDAQKIALESTPRVGHAYNAKLHKLKEELRDRLLIMLYFPYLIMFIS